MPCPGMQGPAAFDKDSEGKQKEEQQSRSERPEDLEGSFSSRSAERCCRRGRQAVTKQIAVDADFQPPTVGYTKCPGEDTSASAESTT